MKWTGKIVGFMIGWFVAGPFTALLGLLIGHFFDKGLSLESFQQAFQDQAQNQQVFFQATFTVMGYIAKSDGRVSEEEIHQARLMMEQMNLNDSQRQQAIHYFNQGKQADFNIQEALAEFKKSCHRSPNLLRLFMEIQFHAARINGQISAEKIKILQYISQYLGFTLFDSSAFDQLFRRTQEQHHHQQRQYQQHKTYTYSEEEPLKGAYQTLGLQKSASDAEVKKAYRRLMSQHHPDKLTAKGLPQSMIKMATQKTQEIKLAYEKIRKVRGIK